MLEKALSPEQPHLGSHLKNREELIVQSCNESKHPPQAGSTPSFPNHYYLEMAQSDLPTKTFQTYRALHCDVPWNQFREHTQL